MALKMNVIERIDTIKANTVTEKQFESVWGISLDAHMVKIMEHVRKSDARIKEERQKEK